jgi:hypothetical protein
MSDAGTATVPGSAATVPGAGGNGAAPTWWQSFDDATKGWLQTRGLDRREAPDAVLQLTKDFRETQSKLGIPADRVLRIPEPTDEAGWKAVHQKLGVPETPDGYDFSTVKMTDGSPLEPDLVTFLRTTAQDLAIPKDRAPRLAAALVKLAAESEAADASAAAIQNGEARLRLQQNWGPNAPNNKFIADRTAAMLGLPPELMGEIEKSPKYDAIMEGLRVAGERMGEAQLIGAGGAGGQQGQIRTKEQAASRIEELIRDPGFAKRRATPGEGGRAAREEWDHLHRMVVQGA